MPRGVYKRKPKVKLSAKRARELNKIRWAKAKRDGFAFSEKPMRMPKPTKRSKAVRGGFRTPGFGKQGYADKIKLLVNSMSEEGAKSLLLKYILES